MSEAYGPDFFTLVDEDGQEMVLELADELEYEGQRYMAFFPTVEEGTGEENDDYGLIILKAIEVEGEEILSTPDTDEELEEVYELFLEQIFAGDDEEDE